jgi:hypothetical protein
MHSEENAGEEYILISTGVDTGVCSLLKIDPHSFESSDLHIKFTGPVCEEPGGKM